MFVHTLVSNYVSFSLEHSSALNHFLGDLNRWWCVVITKSSMDEKVIKGFWSTILAFSAINDL